jgi:hypothetical protein
VKFPFKRPSAEARAAKRARILARGRWSYILRHGILGWGVPVYLFDMFINFPTRHLDLRFLLVNAVGWALGGVFFGWWTWRIEFGE